MVKKREGKWAQRNKRRKYHRKWGLEKGEDDDETGDLIRQ